MLKMSTTGRNAFVQMFAKSLIALLIAVWGKSSQTCCSALFRLHRMHEMLTILIDVRGVSLSVTWLKSAAARAMYAACCVRGAIRYSLHQMPLASC